MTLFSESNYKFIKEIFSGIFSFEQYVNDMYSELYSRYSNIGIDLLIPPDIYIKKKIGK